MAKHMLDVMRSVTIGRPREEVYRFWRALENLPRFMYHVQSVTPAPGGRSHWVVKGPANRRIEWDAEITDDIPGSRIAWQTLPGSDIAHVGNVVFEDAPGDRGTEVRVQLYYDAPGGKAGATIAKLLGDDPKEQVKNDLRRFKQVLETGEVVLSDGSLSGAGQGPAKQRASQPVGAGVWS